MNKIIVSIVLAVILILGINKITDAIFYVEKPEKSAYQVASVTTVASSTSAETNSVNSESENIMALFASTSATEGAKVFKKCAACHSIAEGGSNKIGPAYGECWEDRLVLFQVTNIQKQWHHMVKIGHLRK